MAEGRRGLEPEVMEIFKAIDKGENFLLSGGAGSGKTFSLVQVIRQILIEQPLASIACVTYTNAAVKEIQDRVSHNRLIVSTIHDFMWDIIKHFQKELKKCLIQLLNDDEVRVSIGGVDKVPEDFFNEKSIEYKEYLRLREGIISHDEVIILAHEMFKKYPRLSDILKDRFQFVLVDEYQDTNKAIIEILINHLKDSNKTNIIGFFGDSMQSIYDNTIGDLNGYKDNYIHIKKTQNRRNPQKIIDLANILRTDGIKQVPSNDIEAPNMQHGEVKQGGVLFIYSNNPDVQNIKTYLSDHHGWNFSDVEETKELNLTHNLIAEKAGFQTLINIYDGDPVVKFRDRIKAYIKDYGIKEDFSEMSFGEVLDFLERTLSEKEKFRIQPTASMRPFIEENTQLLNRAKDISYIDFSKMYFSKDQLIDDKKQSATEVSRKGSKRDRLIQHLFRIQQTIEFYSEGRFNSFLKATDYRFKIKNIEDKKELKANIEALINVGDKTIGSVIMDANQLGICEMDDRLEDFKQSNRYLYDRVMEVPFKEFQKVYDYLEGKTPFTTQHKTKGAEFDNVLVILDNGRWNNYNFENLFLKRGSASVLDRTQKIFYVCCTRAKNNLAIFYHQPSNEVLTVAKNWFGQNHVVSLP